jgi:TolB-like protein/cytochrome c-type biogenesis protein CcmH/NrfG
MSFLSELNRRGVTRVAGAYVAVAWLGVQVAETVLPAWGFGDGAIRTLVTLLAIGFVPALVLAWVFEITPSGVRLERDAPAARPASRRLDRVIMALLALALAFFLVERFVIDPARERAALEEAYARGRSEADLTGGGERSIAVLSFANLSGDPAQEYFSDGISEELLNLLARIPELRVVSRSSAFAFKKDNPGIPEIARRLGVAHVLEGSVRIAGDRVRITAQLIDARTDSHLWSETYDRVLDDIFAVQDDIASQVVERLEVSLLGERPRSRTVDPEAYTLYLQATHLAKQSTQASYESALALLGQALERDPQYVDAWLLRSSIYRNQAAIGLRPFQEGLRLGEEAAREALRLDPEDPRARCHLAAIAFDRDRDVQRSARELQGGSGVPTDELCLGMAAQLLQATGSLEPAIRIREHLQARDPVNPVAFINLGYALYLAGRLDEALSALESARTLSPDMAAMDSLLALAYASRGAPGDLERALAAAQREPVEGFRLEAAAIVHHVLGDRAASDAALETLIEAHGAGWPYNIAQVHTARGEADRAFEWLDRAVAYGDSGLTVARVDPLLRPLHGDARFARILERLGLADSQLAGIELEVDLP